MSIVYTTAEYGLLGPGEEPQPVLNERDLPKVNRLLATLTQERRALEALRTSGTKLELRIVPVIGEPSHALLTPHVINASIMDVESLVESRRLELRSMGVNVA